MRLEAGSERGSGAPREVCGVYQDILRGRRSFASWLPFHHTRVLSWLRSSQCRANLNCNCMGPR